MDAIREGRDFKDASVTYTDGTKGHRDELRVDRDAEGRVALMEYRLWGNLLATILPQARLITLYDGGFPSSTTRSRLNVLACLCADSVGFNHKMASANHESAIRMHTKNGYVGDLGNKGVTLRMKECETCTE